MRITIRGRRTIIPFDPKKAIGADSNLARLRRDLIKEAGGNERRVDAFLTERFARALETFSERYLAEQHAHLDRIVELRGEISKIYDGVLQGKTLGPDSAGQARQLFRALSTEMNQLRSPLEALAEAPQIELPPTGGRGTAARGAHTPAERTRLTGLLDAIEDPAGHHPDPFTLPSGADPAASRARSTMEQAIEGRIGDIARREAEARGRGNTAYADRLNREARHLRESIDAQGGSRAFARELRAAIEADPALQTRLLEGGGVSFYQRLWVEYRARKRSSTFGEYVRGRQARELRGLSGELDVAFARSDKYTFLKTPDAWVTRKGTDLIAVDRSRNNLCLLIDNKSIAGPVVESVTSLTRNFARNLRDDIAALKRDVAGQSDLPPEIPDAIARLEKAAGEIEREAAAGRLDPKQSSPEAVQQQIDAILDRNRIRRVVTGEGGLASEVAGDLKEIGVGFYP